jgi:hypothetical protein
MLKRAAIQAKGMVVLERNVSGRSKPATSGRIKPSHFEVR